MSNPFLEVGIVPDVLNALPTHNLGLEVSYKNQIITAGAKIPRNETTTQVPTLRITKKADDGVASHTDTKYTIIMTDPDLFKKNDPTGQVL